MKPIRIQRKRSKGYITPPNTLYCGRGSRLSHIYSNPFKVGETYQLDIQPGVFRVGVPTFGIGVPVKIRDNDHAVEIYRLYRKASPLKKDEIEFMRKFDHLSCWCGLDKKCHVDVLIELL